MAEERHWAADPIEVELQRAAPGRVEKAELVDLTGIETDDLRAGLASLEAEGRIGEDGDGYFLMSDGKEAGPPPPDPDVPEDAPRGTPSDVANAAALQAPGAGPSYRATYGLQLAFAGARGGKRDDAAKETAQQLEEMIADAVNGAVGIGVSVELTDLEAFDSPRRIPLQEDSDSDEEGDADGSNGDGGED